MRRRVTADIRAGRVDGGHDVGDALRLRVARRVEDVRDVGRQRRAHQAAGEHLHDEGQREALRAAERGQHAREGRDGIGGRHALGVEGPARGQRRAVLGERGDLAPGHGGQRHVDDDRPAFGGES
jgi:hypothetical protein